MGEKFKKFVEEGTDSRYIPLGSKCDLCGKKLGFFYTGFWSCNTRALSDGVLCPKCAAKIETLAKEMHTWMPKELLTKWRRYGRKWQGMSVEQVRTLLALKEQNDKERLGNYGGNAQALLCVQESFRIEPKLLAVGMFRINKINHKIVVFGRVDQGTFHKGDAVRIDHSGQIIDTTILEAYEYDPDVPENNFEVCLRANMGKQRLSKDQLGWLILDVEEPVHPQDWIIR